METFNIKFVRVVKKHPVLYDFNLRDYSRKDITEAAWNMVANEVNLSAAESKEKWRNLRSTLAKNLKPKVTSSGASKKKPYYLSEAMQFAVPFIKIAGTPTINLTQDSKPSPSSISISEDFEIENVFSIQESVPESETQPSPTDKLTNITIPPRQDQPITSSKTQIARDPSVVEARGPYGHPVRKRRLLSNTQSDVDKAFLEYFSAKATKLSKNPQKEPIDKREAGITHFVNSLIPDLMNMSDSQLRTFKMETLRLIDDVIISNNTPSQIPSTYFPPDNAQIKFESTE